MTDIDPTIKTFGSEYFKEGFYRPKPPEAVKYGKNHLQIGIKINPDGSKGGIYYLDIEETSRIIILGATRCLPIGTLLKTKDGVVKIEDATKVLSYNFEKNVFEEKNCTQHNTSKLKVCEIHTKYGVLKCSENHKWYVLRMGEILEAETKNLEKKDMLFRFNTIKTFVKINKIKFTNNFVDMIDLEVEDNNNFILENGIISLNSGKTFLMRSMIDRIKTLGDAVIMLLDIKEEMKSSNAPVQEKFRSGLLPGETPKALKIVTLRPTYFKQLGDELPKNNYWYSIDSTKLSRADFMSLMNISELSPTQKTGMELIFQDFQKRIGADQTTQMDFNTMKDIIEENEDLDNRQKQILLFKFKPLENSYFIEKEHAKSIITLLKKGYVPAINLMNYEAFGKGSFGYTEVLLNIAFREIIVARRAKKINRTWIFLDEASRFVGNSKNNSFKDSFLESCDVDTKFGIFLIAVFQSISDVPERVMRQSRYIMIPNSADINTIKQTLIDTGLVKNIQTSVNEAIKLKRRLSKIKYSWIILDRMSGGKELIIPLNPLSAHMESNK